MERLRSIPLRPGEGITMGPFRREVPSPTIERGTAATSAQNVVRTIQGFRKRVLPDEGGNPKALLFRGVPGVKGAMSTGLDFDTVKLEVVTARGGKQLTPSEQQLIQRVIPDRMMVVDAMLRERRGDPDPYATVRDAFDRLTRISQGLIDYFDPNIGEADLSRIAQEVGEQSNAPTAENSLLAQAKAEWARRQRNR